MLNSMASSSSCTDDGRTIVKTIKRALEDLPITSSSASIYKVPKELRAGNENYFTPKTVSIGPLHANSPNLDASKDVKIRYLNSFISRIPHEPRDPHDANLQKIVDVLQGLEKRARDSYADNISLTRDEFIMLMLIDGCFILQLLWRHANMHANDQGDLIFHKGRAKWAMLYNLQQDLLLLENQLPFFVLSALHKLVFHQEDDPDQALANSVFNFFDSIAPTEKLNSRTIIGVMEPKHLLDLVMFSLFPRPSLRVRNPHENPVDVRALEQRPDNFVDVRSVSELDLSGVKFTKCSKEPSYLTDITFQDGVLSVPTVVLLDSTASLFWNLLALEQCSDFKEYGCVFISYISFMDNLICNNKDVEIFTRNDIFLSWVNDDKEFLMLFNRLALAADMDGNNEFSDISRQLETYCKTNIHPLRAYIVRNYFEARWDLMNTVMLFIFTVTHTVFTILDFNGMGKK